MAPPHVPLCAAVAPTLRNSRDFGASKDQLEEEITPFRTIAEDRNAIRAIAPSFSRHSQPAPAPSQYASALGKTANCQTLVSLTLARGEVPMMIALRLFLPPQPK